MFITTVFYLFCGCFGYAAFGNDTPGNLLTGFGFYEPYWLVEYANACIAAHLVGGYQVFSQPLFASAEGWIINRFPNNQFLNTTYTINSPLLPVLSFSILRLCFRTTYVASTTFVAILLPYFNEVLGVLGALNFWPLAIYFPVELHLVQRNIRLWTKKWIIFQVFKAVFLVAALAGLVGSVKRLISARFG
ncbi:hypothetical protein V2J09_002669 [Rumex salicifolius]